MERLTEIDSEGLVWLKQRDGTTRWDGSRHIEKLGAYEDTGLTPEEIRKLVIDVSKGNTSEWQDRLMQMILEKYEEALKGSVSV